MTTANQRRLIPDDTYRFVTVSDPQITADGEVIALVRTHTDFESKEPRSSIWLIPAGGGAMTQFTRSDKSDSSPRWSPDGRRLAFVSDRGGDRQIYLIDRFGGEARQITSMRNGAGGPVWSPDGTRIALISSVGPDDARAGLTNPKPEADKKAEEKRGKDEARTFTRMGWRDNATGIRSNRFAQIWIMEVPEPTASLTRPIQLTWGDFDHSNPHWTPDGQRIAFDAKRSDDEHEVYSDLYLAQVPSSDSCYARASVSPMAPGSEAPQEEETKRIAEACVAAATESATCFECAKLTDSQGIRSVAGISPDGKWLAALGHDLECGFATQDKIYIYPLDGGAPRALDNWDLSIGSSVNADVRPGGGGVDVTWAPDSNMIYAPVSERGACSVYGWPVVGGRPQLIAGGAREIAAGTFDRNCETLAFVAGDMQTISDLWAINLRDFTEQRLTKVNEELFSQLELPKVEELTVKATDGWNLHGWLMKPIGFQAGHKYPVILEIHGGPATCWGHAFSNEFNLLAAQGYGVLFINPRGSTSYGQEFVNAVRGDYGNRDYLDLMSAVDHALTAEWVDEKRLGVTGGSYGGFMTNWIVTQTDRFAVAISHRSISNWVSFSGTPDFGPFFNKDQHHVDDPWSPEGVQALWKLSPLAYAKNVNTPISLMHSEFDYRCPIEQAEQFYMAIKYYQQAPTELVRHPRSNHDLTRIGPPTLRVDRLNRVVKWFGHYCPTEA